MSSTLKDPVGRGEAAFLRPSAGPCEVHDWPTEELAKRLVTVARERHGKGGLNVCVECIRRARVDAARKAGISP
jgi:TPP-dependent trihydroxycyclohexane-1,2-dione (THcHDO) dehydratase